MPLNSSIFSLVLVFVYLSLWYASLNNLFGKFIALDEIPIVMVYGVYFFLYIYYMREFKDLNFFKRFVVPIFALIGAGIILYGGFSNPSIGMYLIINVAVILLGLMFYRKKEAELS